jgi:hypothetical protein
MNSGRVHGNQDELFLLAGGTITNQNGVTINSVEVGFTAERR